MENSLVKSSQYFEYTDEEIEVLRQNKIIPRSATADQTRYFLTVCKMKRLNPFLKHIYMIERKERTDKGEWISSFTIQSSLDGMRAIAQRNCKIISYKRWTIFKDNELYGVCEINTADRGLYYDEVPLSEYVQKKADGTVTKFWKQFEKTMIKKCAEESVLRMLAPEDLSGVYGDEEMQQADREEYLPEPKSAPIDPKTGFYTQPESLGNIIDAELESLPEMPDYLKEPIPDESEITQQKVADIFEGDVVKQTIPANMSDEEEKRIKLHALLQSRNGGKEPYPTLCNDAKEVLKQCTAFKDLKLIDRLDWLKGGRLNAAYGNAKKKYPALKEDDLFPMPKDENQPKFAEDSDELPF